MLETAADAWRDERVLVNGLRDQHPEAIDELVRRYRGPIRRRAARYVRCPADAEDLTQEVLLKVWAHAHRFADDAPLWPWIARTTSNAALSFLRVQRRRLACECPSATGRSPDDDRDDRDDVRREPRDQADLADVRLQRAQLRRHLSSALRTVPIVYRGAVVLRDIHGYSTEEASRSLRVPVPTVKSRVRRGRGLMRRALEPFVGSLRVLPPGSEMLSASLSEQN